MAEYRTKEDNAFLLIKNEVFMAGYYSRCGYTEGFERSIEKAESLTEMYNTLTEEHIVIAYYDDIELKKRYIDIVNGKSGKILWTAKP